MPGRGRKPDEQSGGTPSSPFGVDPSVRAGPLRMDARRHGPGPSSAPVVNLVHVFRGGTKCSGARMRNRPDDRASPLNRTYEWNRADIAPSRVGVESRHDRWFCGTGSGARKGPSSVHRVMAALCVRRSATLHRHVSRRRIGTEPERRGRGQWPRIWRQSDGHRRRFTKPPFGRFYSVKRSRLRALVTQVAHCSTVQDLRLRSPSAAVGSSSDQITSAAC